MSIFMKEAIERSSSIKPFSLRIKNIKQSKTQINQKSIIGDLPDSVDLGEKLKQKDLQIQRLTHALQYYRGNDNKKKSINPFDFDLNQQLRRQLKNGKEMGNEKGVQWQFFQKQISELIEKSSRSHQLQLQNIELRKQLNLVQRQNVDLKAMSVHNEQQSSVNKVEGIVNKMVKQSQIEVNKLKQELWSLQSEINKLNYENTQYKNAINSMSKIKQSSSLLVGQPLVKQKPDDNSNNNDRYQELNKQLFISRQQLMKITKQCQQYKQQLKNIHNINDTKRQRDYNNKSSRLLSPRVSNSNNHININTVTQSQQKVNYITKSFTQLQSVQVQRYQLKLSQRNHQYQELYMKYQKVQSQKIVLQDMNQQIQRERKFLADRLGEIEILQQGDQVVGEMENKLVLMSTQLMRLGNMNRNKLKQTQQVNMRLKQAIHKLQISSKQLIQKQKIILNYKQQLALITNSYEQRQFNNNQDMQLIQEYRSQLTIRDKQISRVNYLCQQLQQDTKTYQLKLRLYQQKILRLQQQNKQLQKQLNQTQKSIITETNSHNFTLNLQIQNYKNTLTNYQTQIKTLYQKNTLLKTQLNSTHQKIQLIEQQKHSLQQNYTLIKTNIKKLQFNLQQKDNILRDIKHQYEQKLIIKNEEIRDLSQKLVILQKNKDTLMRSPKKMNQQEKLLSINHKLQQENMLLKIQLSKHQQIISKLNYEIQSQTMSMSKIYKQNQTIQVLNKSIRQKEKEYKQLKRQLQSMTNLLRRVQTDKGIYENKVKQLLQQQRQLQKYQTISRQLKDQLQIANSQLQMKTQQYQLMESKFYSSNKNIISSQYNKRQQQQIITLNEHNRVITRIKQQHEIQINSLKQQRQQQQQKYISKHTHSQISLQSQSQLIIHQQLSEQIIRLNTVLAQRTNQLIKLQKDLELTIHKLNTCQQILNKERQHKLKQITSYTSLIDNQEIQRINQNYNHNNQNNNNNKYQNNNQNLLLNQRVSSLKQTNTILQNKLQQSLKQKVILQHRLSQLQYSKRQRSAIYHQNQSHLGHLVQEIRVSNKRLQQSISQIEKYYLNKLNDKQNEYNELIKQSQQQKYLLEKTINQLKFNINKIQTESISRVNLLQSNNKPIQQYEQLLKINTEYQYKLVLISQEIQRSQIVIQQKGSLISKLKQQISKYEVSNKGLIVQNETNLNTIEILSQEIQRLCGVLAEHIEQITKKDKCINTLSQQMQSIEANSQLLKTNTYQLQSSIKQLNENRNKLQFTIRQLQNKNIILTQQLNYLQSINTQLQSQLRDITQKQFNNEQQKHTINYNYIPKIDYQNIHRQLSQTIIDKTTLQHQNNLLKQHLDQIKYKLQAKQKQCQTIQKEKNNIIQQKIKSNQSLQQQINQHKIKITQIQNNQYSFKTQINLLKHESEYKQNQLEKANQQLSIKNKQLEIKLQELNKYKQQSVRIKQQLQQLILKSESLDRLKQRQKDEVEYREKQSGKYLFLQQQIQQLKQSNNSLQEKFELILNENQKLVYQVESFKRNKSTSTSSNNNNNNRNQLQQVVSQLKGMNKNYQEQLSQLRVNKSSLHKQINQLQLKVIQNNKYKLLVQTYEQQLTEQQNKYKKLIIQKNTLYQQFSKLQSQYKSKCYQLKTHTQTSNKLQSQLYNVKTVLQKTNIEITQLKKDKKLLKQKIQSIKNINSTSNRTSQQNNNNKNVHHSNKTQYYTRTIKMSSIDQVDQKQERSRGPSQHQNQHQNISSYTIDKESLIQKYQLLESINIKLKKQNQSYRKKSIQYEFKMNKLKQQFDLLSKLINQYREENQTLKKTQKNNINQKNNNNQNNNNNHFILVKENHPQFNNQSHINQQQQQSVIKNQQQQYSSIINQQQQHYHSQSQSQSSKLIQHSSSPIMENQFIHINGQSSSIIRPLSPNMRPLSPNMRPISPNTSKIIIQKSPINTNHTNKNIQSNQHIHHDYNDLKQSMQQINTQLSQINRNSQQTSMITLPISQIHMLINEIQRLFAENKSLSQQLNDCSVLLIELRSNKTRHQENLATFVIMIVEIQALRHRVAVAQAQKQNLRRQGLSPTRSNR